MRDATPPQFADAGRGGTRVSPTPSQDDDPREPMATEAISLHDPPGDVRCECLACGCHVLVQGTRRLGGACGNCGSYDLRPLAVAPAPLPPVAPVASVARLDPRPPLRVAWPAARVA